MEIIEIIIRIAGALILGIGDAIFTNIFCKPNDGYFAKKAKLSESEAANRHTVQMSKELTAMFTVCILIINVTEIIIIAWKSLITEFFGFDYLTTLTIWTTSVALNDFFVYFMFTKASYDDEKITVKKPLQKAKTYYFDDIVDYSANGNLKVKTTNGSFMLFNSFAGTETLRGIIIDKVFHKKNVGE